jgi:Kef-type K+ transport system membrane component KefB
MTDHAVLVFFLALAVLLASARIFGELARTLGLPLVVGEIAAGVLAGPTALGRISPRLHAWLFPTGEAASMLGA